MFGTLLPFVVASLATSSLCTVYTLSDNHVGSNFLSTWTHQAIPDPTNGRVNYVNQAIAVAQNLTYASVDTLIMRADSKTKLTASGPGRNSVRIRSRKTYRTHVAVFDIRHMPEGCSTWPAAWETSEDDWPDSGEVDITLRRLEGVNDQSPNAVTLHTGGYCKMPASRTQTGTNEGLDCDVNSASGDAGCSVLAPTANSYGPAFNANGGGFYAMERTPNFMKVWFWPRGSGSVPSGVLNGGNTVDTGNWGTPTAFFPNTDCDINARFGAHNIIINLTLCGDWAGIPELYNGAGCPGKCETYVENNPSAFAKAYWDIAAVRVYQ